MNPGSHFAPPEASTIAPWVDGLLAYLTIASFLTTLLVAALVVVFLIRYRQRPNRHARQIRGSLPLEIGWTIAPLIVMLTFFFAGASVYSRYQRPPQGAMDVYVVAKQWMWTLQHPQGPREKDALHVPMGTPVRLIMTSEDVVHSFFAPAFRIKQDVLPNRTTQTWFEATEPGRYRLYCAEYCGTSHSNMKGWITVMEPQEFQAWLEDAGQGPSMAAAGEKLFQQLGCAQCHAGTCPPLGGLFGSSVPLEDGSLVTADIDYLRNSILNPQAQIVAGYPPQMPTFKGQVTESELQQLIAYIRSLSEQGAAGSSQAPPSGVRSDIEEGVR
ncbi:MAG: cytochrome c oxidase subunit II [Bryobacterales bacterium]